MFKRVLIISYYWPPTGGSGVQRWVKFCKYLPLNGWNPVVYTPLNPERLAYDESLLKDIPESVEIIKTKIFEPYSFYRKLMGKKSEEVNPVNSQKKGLLGRFSMWVRGNCFIPDPRIMWVKPSVKFLINYLKEHPVDVIVTTGPPQSMHLIGLGLKKALGIRWIADFRDPWTELFYYKHLGLSSQADRKHHKLEKEVLDNADKIIAVSPLVAEDFRIKIKTEVVLITNGFDKEDYTNDPYEAISLSHCKQCSVATATPRNDEKDPRNDGKATSQLQMSLRTEVKQPQVSTNEESFHDDEKVKIVHTGLFADDGNPTLLWEVLKELSDKKIEIRLAGKTDKGIIQSIEEMGLNYTDLGYIPHNQVIKEQREASILILPLRKEPEYLKVLPGKIFEYIASGRPVLGIGQSNGAAAKLLEDSGVGRMFEWDDKDGIRSFLLDPQYSTKNIEKYSREYLTKELVRVLDVIANGSEATSG